MKNVMNHSDLLYLLNKYNYITSVIIISSIASSYFKNANLYICAVINVF